MPTDADIVLGIKPAHIATPQELQTTALENQQRAQAVQTGALDLQEKQRTAVDRARIRSVLTQYGGDFEKALPTINQINPELGLSLQKSLTDAKTHVLDYQIADLQHQQAQRARAAAQLVDIDSQQKLDAAHITMQSLGEDPAQLPDLYDPDTTPKVIAGIRQRAMTLKEQHDAQEKTLADQRAEAEATRRANADAETARKNAAVEAERARHQQEADDLARRDRLADNDRQAARDAETARHNRVDERIAGQRAATAGAAGGSGVADVKEAVAGMKDGTIPPQLPGRASKEYVATMAEAHRQNYDLASAATDWIATQKHIATMNNAQQLRLNQSINQLPELLDSVDALASKWKAGRFPLLNKANLALAKGGAFGKDAAVIANQLDAQIADVTADLGNVYMGGNSPTDHALGLAAKSLSADWDEKVLHAMTALARQNVTIRQNSIKHTGVQGASENNPYAPKVPAQTAPQAPAAPAGWKYVPKPGGGWTAVAAQ